MMKGLTNIKALASFIKLLASTIYRVFALRLCSGLMIQYPRHIRAVSKEIPKYKEPKFLQPQNSISSVKLTLAIGSISFKDRINWKVDIQSHEQFVSLHRWNWLLRRAFKKTGVESFNWGIELLRSWLYDMGATPRGDASESYTIGERISNACLFTRQTLGNWNSIPIDLKDAIKYKTKYLASRLEYIPGNLTGNHLINNARALLLAGHCCDLEAPKKLARLILKENLSTIIDKQGFLREGSSHYQFLITRWILEIRFVAEENDDFDTIEIIKSHLPMMIKACQFFLVNNKKQLFTLPLFGDISPDCDPEWLIHLHKSRLAKFDGEEQDLSAKGWAALFKDFKCNPKIVWSTPEEENRCWYHNEACGWYRLNFLDWVAIWHIENPTGQCIASHAHHDAGSLVLFKSGEEILIDSGRYEYENTPISNYGLTPSAHTSVTLDNYPMMMSRRDHRFHEKYKKTKVIVNFEFNPDECSISIQHDGFKRLPKNIGIHERVFKFSKDKLVISDYVDGSSEVNIKTSFQLPLNYQHLNLERVSDNIGTRKVLNGKLSGSNDPLGGWRFKSFGTKERSVTKTFDLQTTLPYYQNFIISTVSK